MSTLISRSNSAKRGEQVNRKQTIHNLLGQAAVELLSFIEESQPKHKAIECWVPAAELKRELELNFVAVPKSGKQYGEKGWVFASLMRMLEDQGLVEYRKSGSRAYYRSLRHRLLCNMEPINGYSVAAEAIGLTAEHAVHIRQVKCKDAHAEPVTAKPQ